MFGHGMARAAGLTAWFLMSIVYAPTVRYYRISLWWSLVLARDSLSSTRERRCIRRSAIGKAVEANGKAGRP